MADGYGHIILLGLKDDDFCAYVFYDDYKNNVISNIFIGKVVKYLVPIPGTSNRPDVFLLQLGR